MIKDLSTNKLLQISHTFSKLRLIHIKGAARIIQKLISLLPLPKPTGPVIVSTLHGYKLIVDPLKDKGIEDSLFRYGTYEEGTLNLIQKLLTFADPKGVFIDVGANIGLISLFVSRTFSNSIRIYAFEPLPSTFNILNENIKLNEVNNIIPLRKGLGSSNKNAEIFESNSINRGASSFVKESTNVDGFQTEIIKLDDFVQDESIDSINCIKIDVKGWELEVLKGAESIFSAPNAPACIIEYSIERTTFGGQVTDIYHYFKKVNNFSVFKLTHGKEKPSKLVKVSDLQYLPDHDNIICLTEKHIANLPKKIFS